MKYKVGDKVKFLNKVGGGYITQISANGTVKVMVEGGFEYPVLENELILINPQTGVEKFFDEDFHVPVNARKQKMEDYELMHDIEERKQKENAKKETKIIFNTNEEKLEQGLILAFIPDAANGSFMVSVINYTPHKAFFQVFLKLPSNLYKGFACEHISALSRINIAECAKADIESWNKSVFQAVFFSDEPKTVPPPIHTELKIKKSFFDNLENFRKSNILESCSLTIILNDLYYDEKLYSLKEEPKLKEEQLKPKALIDRHRIDRNKAEVDLHISALRDNYSSLKNAEILSIQKEYFLCALDSAIENHYTEVVFIHGIGNGVLKNAIIKLLKDRYDDLSYRDAPFSKYGYGALTVLLRSLALARSDEGL